MRVGISPRCSGGSVRRILESARVGVCVAAAAAAAAASKRRQTAGKGGHVGRFGGSPGIDAGYVRLGQGTHPGAIHGGRANTCGERLRAGSRDTVGGLGRRMGQRVLAESSGGRGRGGGGRECGEGGCGLRARRHEFLGVRRERPAGRHVLSGSAACLLPVARLTLGSCRSPAEKLLARVAVPPPPPPASAFPKRPPPLVPPITP